MRRTSFAWIAVLALILPTAAIASQIDGTNIPYTLSGSAGPDTINGRGGNDRILGLGSGDRLLGKTGSDTLIGGAGPDRLFGGAGRDQVKGGPGNDILDGAEGDDLLIGAGGNDIVFAGAGSDRVNVRDGRQDTVDCGTGTDTVVADLKDRATANCERVQRPAPPNPPPNTGGGSSRPAPSDAYNCDDFPLSDGTTAQQYLALYPSDPSGLDGNNDGVACEG